MVLITLIGGGTLIYRYTTTFLPSWWEGMALVVAGALEVCAHHHEPEPRRNFATKSGIRKKLKKEVSMDINNLERLYRKIEDALLVDDQEAKQNNIVDALEIVKDELNRKTIDNKFAYMETMKADFFEIEDVIKIEKDGYKLALVKLIVPRFKDPVFDQFLLTRNQEWRLTSFFRSIGEKKRGETYRMDWDHIKGKFGLCKINDDGIVERYFDKINLKDVGNYSLNLELKK